MEEAALLGRDVAAAGSQTSEHDGGLAAALAAAIESSGNSGSTSSGRLLRNGAGLLPASEDSVGVLRYDSVEVPDWSHGIHDKPQDPSDELRSRRQRPTLDFRGPLPPMGAWVPASFSNYGKRHPMGPLLIACSLKPPKTATCEVLHDGSRSSRNVALYRAWSMWGDRAKGQAYVSLLSGSITGATLQGVAEEQQMSCCENTNNSEGCVACTGLPSTSYNPLNIGADTEVEGTETEDRPHSYAPPSRYPISQSAEPVQPSELFDILPNLKEQLGENADPENLPCVPSDDSSSNLPSLGDIFRSRKDLTLAESMVKTSHIQQLIPCELTFVAVSDENAVDYQGQKPPACLADALNRPENQRDMLRLVGRNALLGKKDPLPISSEVPLLYGKPARTALWGETPTWNNTQLTGEKILFDKGVIHLLSRNDMSDPDSRELLRKIVFWSCLHDHLVHHPALTRFALIMVDNGRALPIIGTPPGPRPDWVARGNQGWFAPPKAKSVGDGESEDESEEEARDSEEEKRPNGKPEDTETKQKPEEEADKHKPEEGAERKAESPKPEDEAAAKQKPEEEKEEQKPKPEDGADAKQKPEEADRPKPKEEEERPKPDEKGAPKHKPEEEGERPKPEEAAGPKPGEENRPEPKGDKEAERPKPEEDEASRLGEERKDKPEPEEGEAAARQESEERDREKAEEKRRAKPEEAEKPGHEDEAAARQHAEEAARLKPEEENKEDGESKPDEKEEAGRPEEKEEQR